jgi:hypothetical protein
MTQTTKRCADCGEVMPILHDCAKAREARALFEAAKRANHPDSARGLGDAAYDIAVQAEVSDT